MKLHKILINLDKVKEQDTVNLNRPKSEIIQEIHDTVDSEWERLLEEAKITTPVQTDKQELIDKAERLEKLGFKSTKTASIAREEKRRLSNIKFENNKKQELVNAINYFSQKYPHYKFITEDSVKKICEKYNLIYGEVGNYIGEVPTKNLQDIEKFSIKDEDKLFLRIKDWFKYDIDREEITYEQYKQALTKIDTFVSSNYVESYTPTPLEIMAPSKEFDTRNMKLDGFKLSKVEIEDPIVLQPVMYKGTKHYLVVTAWGLESSDELVVNQKMN